MSQKTIGSLFVVFLVAGCQTTSGPSWKCSAENLAESRYYGGSTAKIRLAGFSKAGSYSVTKSPDGKTATGKTGNGTPFSCVAP